jgi:hypothetical protein
MGGEGWEFLPPAPLGKTKKPLISCEINGLSNLVAGTGAVPRATSNLAEPLNLKAKRGCGLADAGFKRLCSQVYHF